MMNRKIQWLRFAKFMISAGLLFTIISTKEKELWPDKKLGQEIEG